MQLTTKYLQYKKVYLCLISFFISKNSLTLYIMAGAPTKYKPEYKDVLLNLMKQGASIEEICLELEVCRQTLYNWFEKYPEFLDTKKKAVEFSKGWWMKQGRTQLENKDFNYTGWYMNMKNRFGWADKSETKNENTNINTKELTAEEIKMLNDNLEKTY